VKRSDLVVGQEYALLAWKGDIFPSRAKYVGTVPMRNEDWTLRATMSTLSFRCFNGDIVEIYKITSVWGTWEDWLQFKREDEARRAPVMALQGSVVKTLVRLGIPGQLPIGEGQGSRRLPADRERCTSADTLGEMRVTLTGTEVIALGSMVESLEEQLRQFQQGTPHEGW
jgi:hypothetical protein